MTWAESMAHGASRILGAVLLGLIAVWRYGLSAIFPPSCRFEPSCSTYARDAVRIHGPWRGGRMALWRVLRCNPWSHGFYDPVPLKDRLPEPGRPSAPRF